MKPNNIPQPSRPNTPRKPRKRRGREEFPHVPRICSLDPAAINRCTTSKMDAIAGSLGSSSSTVPRQSYAKIL